MLTRHDIPLRRLLAACLALGPLLAAPSPARAGAHVGVDFDLGAPLHSELRLATGLGARGGYRFDLGPVWLQPEAGACLVHFDGDGRGGPPLDVPRFLGGVRLGFVFARIVQPALYTHGGIGWYGSQASGATADLGLAVEVAPVRHFTFGAQLAYNVVDAGLRPGAMIQPWRLPVPGDWLAVQWISAGVHGGFTF
jgi:hypothetical protein